MKWKNGKKNIRNLFKNIENCAMFFFGFVAHFSQFSCAKVLVFFELLKSCRFFFIYYLCLKNNPNNKSFKFRCFFLLQMPKIFPVYLSNFFFSFRLEQNQNWKTKNCFLSLTRQNSSKTSGWKWKWERKSLKEKDTTRKRLSQFGASSCNGIRFNSKWKTLTSKTSLGNVSVASFMRNAFLHKW